MKPWQEWDHVVKIDPDKSLPRGNDLLELSDVGTDAIVIGGTTGVTSENVASVLNRCADCDVPIFLEPNSPATVVDDDRLEGYLIPSVFNTDHPFWTVGAHVAGATANPDHPWGRSVVEAYLVLNPESSVARYTAANCDLSPEDVEAYATVVDRVFDLEILYLEYSGTLGDPDLIEIAADACQDTSLFYGGGVHDYDSARLTGAFADVVVVGDVIHDRGIEAVEETVEGVSAADE